MKYKVLLLLLLLKFQAALSLDIYVDPENSSSNSNCWTGGQGEPCSSLSLALEGLQRHNHTTVWLVSDFYVLQSKTPEPEAEEGWGDYLFVWMVDIAISASQSDEAAGPVPVVACEDNVGLAFLYSTNVTIRGVEFVGCGAYRHSTSRASGDRPFQGFHVALYFLYVTHVTLDSVGVASTPGTGVVMYAVSGSNAITNSHFSNNSVAHNVSGGGGLYLEFSYCVPTLQESAPDCSSGSNVPQSYVTGGQFLIQSCTFSNNTARVRDETQSTFILPRLETHLAFGRGAGLSLFFKGRSAENSVLVRGCNFTGNRALWGAGLFAEYQDWSINNSLKVDGCELDWNRCFNYASEEKGTGGGGARLGYIFFDPTHVSHNSMSFVRVNFSKNRAYYGGGVSFYAAREPDQPHPTNTLTFRDCEWVLNVARVGSGVDLSVWHPIPHGATPTPEFSSCSFLWNTADYTSLTAPGKYVGIGALYSDFIPIHFYGPTKFQGNSQTALACIGAELVFRSNCSAEFLSNTGRNGGGVALMGYSFIQVSANASLSFMGNTAEFAGGAIYAQSVGEHDLISSRNCFIRYEDITVTPLDWEASFHFRDNLPNSIYATSLLTCLWGGAFGSTSSEIQYVFCWNRNLTHPEQWVYASGDCAKEIATSPAKFVPQANSSSSSDTEECEEEEDGEELCYIGIHMIPGLSRLLPFSTTDDKDNNVTDATVLTAKLLNESDVHVNDTLYISDNSIQMQGVPGDSAYIRLETIAPRVISMMLKVNFSQCPPGMVASGPKCQCGHGHGGLIQCHSSKFYSELRRGVWIGQDQVEEEEEGGEVKYVAGECPYCSFNKNRTIDLPRNGSELQEKLCGSINRTGVLCGSCLPGYGPVVNGYTIECHNCSASEAKYNWVFYLLTEFLPVTIFFLLVVLLNVSVTSGPANAFVFFAQVLTTAFKVDGDGAVLQKTPPVLTTLYVIPYDIWNQNFFHPILPKFCLSRNISTLQLLSTGYVTALYPLLLVVVFSLVVWAYGRGLAPVVCLCRPVHRCFARLQGYWNIRRSIVHALATYVVISYAKFTLVSFVLLTSTPLLNSSGIAVRHVLYYDGTIGYMSSQHAPYVITSLFVLAIFVALPPLVLSLPSLIHQVRKIYAKVFHKDLELPAPCHPPLLLHQFLDAFHGCYKDGTGGGGEGSVAGNDTDCRWFAGLYFALRLIIFLVFAVTPNWFLQYVVQQLVCLVALLLFAVLRPYKNPFFNAVDVCIFANLAAISTLSMLNFHATTTGREPSRWSWGVQFLLIFLPLIYMVCYVLYVAWKKLFRGWGSLAPRVREEEEDTTFLQHAEAGYRDLEGSYQKRSASRLSGSPVSKEGGEEGSLQSGRGDSSSGSSGRCGYGATSGSIQTRSRHSTSGHTGPSSSSSSSIRGAGGRGTTGRRSGQTVGSRDSRVVTCVEAAGESLVDITS